MHDWIIQAVTFLVGLFSGGTIGSLLTIKFVKNSNNTSRSTSVRQSAINAGRDNIGGDRVNKS